MLRAWAEGSDDGWQAELWRRLRERIGEPSPAERLDDACARLRAEPALVDLPARVSLFGLTRLPASYLDVLHALAAERDVHLFLLHPSAELWARIAVVHARPPADRAPRRGRDRGAAAESAARLLGAGRSRDAARPRRRPRRRRRPRPPSSSRSGDRRCSAESRPTFAPTARRRACRSPAPATSACCSSRTIEACRCTPATAAPARSRWCATRSCTCSPTTRRWSRATSSSCAPTSRSSRR